MPTINNIAIGLTVSAAGVHAAQTATINFEDTIPVMTTSTNTTLDGVGVRPEAIADHEISVYTDQETRSQGLSYEQRHCLDGEGPACDAIGSGEDVWTPAFVRDVYNNTRSAVNGTAPIGSSFMRLRMGTDTGITDEVLGRRGKFADGNNQLKATSLGEGDLDYGIYDEDEDVEVHINDVDDEDEVDEAKTEETATLAQASGMADEVPVYPWEVPSCSSDDEQKAKRLMDDVSFFHSKGTSTRRPPLTFREGANGNITDAEELLDSDYYLYKESSIFDELDASNNMMREAFTLLIAAISTALVLVGRRAPAKHAVY